MYIVEYRVMQREKHAQRGEDRLREEKESAGRGGGGGARCVRMRLTTKGATTATAKRWANSKPNMGVTTHGYADT